MPQRDDSYYKKHIAAMLEKLTERGWIQVSGFHDTSGKYAFKWTSKGLERSKWVKEITTDLHLGPEGMCALLSICELHADEPPKG